MSKTRDFTKNMLAMMIGSDEESEASNRRNREIIKNATDEELQEIVEATGGRIGNLDELKNHRDLFRTTVDEILE
ncbi:MAG: hypothetical protein AAB874_03615 [Patescibacteria group bacterium]